MKPITRFQIAPKPQLSRPVVIGLRVYTTSDACWIQFQQDVRDRTQRLMRDLR